MQQQNNIRLDYLDAARGIALMLGIVFHAIISFMPIFIGWAVMDISTNEFVPIFMLISHSFRMELFFLIAGFFSHLTFHQQGICGFLKSRLIRIGIPFVIGWFLLRPLLASGWIMGGQSMRGDVNILNGLLEGLKSLSELPNGLLVGTHLWFLYYLLLICVAVLLVRHLIGLHKPVRSELTQLADRLTVWLCNSRLAILVLSIPTACCLWFMDHWGMDTPDKSLLPHIPVSFLYGGFFLFGWLLHRQSSLIDRFASLTWGKFILCIISIVVTIWVSSFEMKFGHPQYILLKSCFILNYAIMMWSLVSLTLGLCKRIFTAPNQVVRYIADSSYWLYLIHLPLVIWLQITFAERPIYWLIKLVGISAITILITILIYDAFIRSTFIGAVLNGKRKSRYLFKFNSKKDKTKKGENPIQILRKNRH
jgi:glucan biosynthesis protein C